MGAHTTPKLADGSTLLLGIVGDPIAQVRTPEVLTPLFRANGVNALCVALHVTAAEFGPFLAGLRTIRNIAGLIVTIPHKPAASRHVDVLTPRARLVRSVNVMRLETDGRWTGDMLDGVAFVRGMIASGQRIEGRRALVVGAGGAGAAIAFAIAEEKAASVHVCDLDADRAADLAQRLEAAGVPSGVSPAVADGFDMVVNASPVGMKPSDPIAIDCARLAPDAIAGDVVNLPTTPFLDAARARGGHVQPGMVMMLHQLPAMQEFFRFPPGDYGPEAIARLGISA